MCTLPELARTYDLAGRDSAIVGCAWYLSTADDDRWRVDASALPHVPHAVRRLGERYEERGDHVKAFGYYHTVRAIGEVG